MDETIKIWCLYPQHTRSRTEQLITDLAVETYFFFSKSILAKFINWWDLSLQWKIFTDFIDSLIYIVKLCLLVSVDPETRGVPFASYVIKLANT